MTLINKMIARKPRAHNHEFKLMGCRFGFTAIHENPDIAWRAMLAAIAEIERIEDLISSWKSSSQTSAINQMAGIQPVQIESELFQLIKRSNQVAQLTKGAFDMSGTLARDVWQFSKKESELPTEYRLDNLRKRMGYRKIILNESAQSVFLTEKGMKIGFGGIGKGYAAVRAKIIMMKMGIKNGLVNASGDLLTWGKPVGQEVWEIKIRDPQHPDYILAILNIKDHAIVTSGESESYALINGKRYSHIIDPRTGWPVEGLKMVSVVCPNPELADALATAISVMGEQEGLALINQLKGIECLLLNHQNELKTSNNFKTLNL